MRKFQRILMAGSLALLALLAGLSIVGAFLGARRAEAMFTSPPMVVLWCLLAGLLVTGVLAWPMMLRRPGLLAVHVGALLVLAGGMWGSRYGHALREAMLGRSLIREGFVMSQVGQSASEVVEFSPGGEVRTLGTLGVGLKPIEAWTEYYPPRGSSWTLQAVFFDEADEVEQVQRLPLGAEDFQEIGRTGLSVRVESVQSARPGENHRGLEPGRTVVLQIDRGEEIARMALGAGSEPDVPRWTAPLEFAYDSREAWVRDGRVELWLLRPVQAVKDYKVDLAVLGPDGEERARQIVELNRPLRVGGLYVYLAGLPMDDVVLLQVVRDPGLVAVWAGFGLLGGGMVLACWGGAGLRWIRCRKAGAS